MAVDVGATSPASGSQHSPLSGPSVRTELPGPRSRRLLDRQEAHESNARAYPRRIPIAIARGAGPYLEDEDGNVFIDFLNGAGVLALGHSHPDLVAAMCRQAEQLGHGLDFPTAVKDEFTSRLIGLFPPGMREDLVLHFCGPTGANAVEAAIKLCKTATGRSEVIAFQGGFHGMTHGAMAVSSESTLRSAVPNVMGGVHFFPFGSCHDCPLGLSPESCTTNCAEYLERALEDTHSGVGRPAAVIVELVQGEGGGNLAAPSFVRRLREVTARLEIPLVVDEVQTGCGRTGQWFSFQHYGIEPDVVVLSKMLSGIGAPAAVVAYHRRLDVWKPGAHTGTFRGNQPAFAAGTRFIDIVERDAVLANVRDRGQQARALLESLRAEHDDLVADVRVLGLMVAVEFRRTTTTEGPAAVVQREALRRGLIVETGGRFGTVVRMLPPLNIDAATMATAMDIFAQAVAAGAGELLDATVGERS